MGLASFQPLHIQIIQAEDGGQRAVGCPLLCLLVGYHSCVVQGCKYRLSMPMMETGSFLGGCGMCLLTCYHPEVVLWLQHF